MRIRKLEKKDAELMLEWMHDDSVTSDLASNFKDKTLEDCYRFIEATKNTLSDIHYAIVSDEDEYMGTVSLKHVDRVNSRAEFAIAIRKKAMGKGYSLYGMNEILKKGLYEENLNSIYWCVSKNNLRACKFYDKHHFDELLDIDQVILESYKDVPNLKWYIVKKDYFDNKVSTNTYNLCRLINIKTIGTEKSGKLSFVEENRDVPFDFKRLYYISDVDEGVRRGFHAHKQLKQLLFCPYGKINIVLHDGCSKEEILLEDPSVGIVIEKPLWREMIWIEKKSVLAVLASEFYDENDYIRNYDDFLKFMGRGKD